MKIGVNWNLPGRKRVTNKEGKQNLNGSQGADIKI